MNVRLAIGISVGWIPLAFLFDGVTVLVLPIRLAGITGEASTIGLISFLGLGTAVAVQPVVGRLSDRLRGRLGRRRLMALAAVPAIAGLSALTGPVAIPVAAAGYVLVQASAAVIQTGQQTLIPEHVNRHRRGLAAGLKSAFDVGGALLAFTILGTLLASGDTTAAASAITALLLASIVAVALLVPASPRHRSRPSPEIATLPPGFGRLVAARFLFLFGIYGIGRFLLLLVAHRLGIEPARAADETGGLLAVFTLVTAVAAVPFGRLADSRGREPVMAVGVVLSAVGIALFLPSAGLLGVVAAGLLMSAGTAAFVTGNWAATTDFAPAEEAGRLMGIANIGTGGAAACAGLLGPLIDAGGFAPAIVVAMAASAAAVVPLMRTPALATLKGSP